MSRHSLLLKVDVREVYEKDLRLVFSSLTYDSDVRRWIH